MEIILRDHVEHLGVRGQIVKVADGYARNYPAPEAGAARDRRQQEARRARTQDRRSARGGRTRSVAGHRHASWLARTGLHPQGGRHRAALRLGDEPGPGRCAQGEGLRRRPSQDPAAGCHQGARRVHGAGQAAPRRDRAAQGDRLEGIGTGGPGAGGWGSRRSLAAISRPGACAPGRFLFAGLTRPDVKFSSRRRHAHGRIHCCRSARAVPAA